MDVALQQYRSPSAMKVNRRHCFLSSLLLAGVWGCARPAPPAAPEGAIRIVSLAPSLTEIICAIGAADELAGRTSACNFPPDAVTNVPVVGGFGVPSLERLLACRPTVVLDVDLADTALRRRIRDLGVAHRRIPCVGVNDIAPAIRAVGAICGRAAQAESLARRIETGLADLRESTRAVTNRPTVYAEIWNDPLTTVGRGAFLSDLIRLAGGRNAGDDVARDYFQIAHEQVLAMNPDVILCLYMSDHAQGAASVRRRPGWQDVKAVRTGAVYDGLDNDVILRPGPRVLEGVAAVRACIAGGASTRREGVER
jgi:iron complex transport system substrate-binding protein